MCLAGTFISAFSVLCGARSELISERGVCCVFWLNVAAALIQILTAVIMVGWIMSIFWGMDMVILASQSSTICSSAKTALFNSSIRGVFGFPASVAEPCSRIKGTQNTIETLKRPVENLERVATSSQFSLHKLKSSTVKPFGDY